MKKILVIEDESGLRALVAKTLRHLGYEVIEAADGETGLVLARSRSPDLVLSDIHIGRVDGFAVLRSLRSQPGTAGIPVILMTGEPAGNPMRHGMDCGADDFLPKPFTGEALTEAVRARFERQQIIQDQVLRESEHRYRELVNNQGEGVVFSDPNLRFTFANPAAESIFGVGAGLLIGRTLEEFLGEADRAIVQEQRHLRLAGQKSTYEVEIITTQNQRRQILITGNPQIDTSGEFRGTFAIFRDITERKQIEADLVQKTALFEALVNSSPDGILVIDGEGRRIVQNPQFNELLKIPPELALDADTAQQFRHVVDSASLPAQFAEKVLYLGAHPRETSRDEIAFKDGRILDRFSAPVLAPDGRHWGRIWSYRDITERRRMEQALQDSEEKFRQLADNVPDAVVRIDRELRFVYGNRALAGDLGLEPKSFLGKSVGELNLPALAHWQGELRRVFETGQAHSFEFQLPGSHDDGFRESRLVPECSANGEVEFVISVTRDVTRQKQAERERQLMELQLRQAQKLEAIGQLAAGIAHEINTPTQYVGDNTRFLKDSFAGIMGLLRSHVELLTAAKENRLTPDLVAQAEETLMASDIDYLYLQIPQAIEETLEGVARVTKIVRAMKEFSHPGSQEKSAANLNKAIESTTTVARNEWKYVADVNLDLDPALPMIPCFIGEFNQVILNLIVNAAHAIGDVKKKNPGEKGVITIQTRCDGKSATVRVSDTGTGIPEIHRRRIFEPFFTTKDVGKGSGQGLAYVYTTIVKKHGGTVTFETETGTGTTFIVQLPINPQNPGVEKTLIPIRENISARP